MNYLYRLSQTQNRGYDTFDSCIVCAPDEDTARNYHPSGQVFYHRREVWETAYDRVLWADAWGWANNPEAVTVERIGIADETTQVGVVCASFNAG
jgi:hypothetical protein